MRYTEYRQQLSEARGHAEALLNLMRSMDISNVKQMKFFGTDEKVGAPTPFTWVTQTYELIRQLEVISQAWYDMVSETAKRVLN